MTFLNITPNCLDGICDCVDRIVLKAFFPMERAAATQMLVIQVRVMPVNALLCTEGVQSAGESPR
jgi:hypothetical protein